jgi:RHS repeat-associated protein
MSAIKPTKQHQYDAYGNLITLSHEQGGTVMHKFDYQYDGNQNRTQETEFNGIDTLITDFDYDSQDRLTQAIYAGDSKPQNNGTATYTYDDNSNRETETFTTAADVQSKNITYGYDNNDQLTSIVDSVESANTVVDYDTLGNLTQKAKTEGGQTHTTNYIYDARNQLKQVQMGGSTIGAFLYDANGLRVHKSETLTDANTQIASTTQQRYHYQGLNVIGSFDENNNSQYRYYHDGNQILARINESAFTTINVENNAVQTYHQDALGSTAVISNRDGSLTARYQYDAFGNVQTETGESETNDFTYTGHERDQASGLIYAKARYYDPQLGLFLSRDPFEGYDNTPLSLHRYLYAYQNPMKYVDPDGRNPIEDFVGDLKSAAVDYAVDLAYDAAATVMNSAIDSVTPDEGSAADYAVQAHVEVANTLVIDPAKAAAESIQNVRNGEYTDAAVALGAGLVLHKADRIAQITGVDKVAGKFADGVTGLVQEAKTKLGVGVAPKKSRGMPDLAKQRAELRVVGTTDFTTAQKGVLGESRTALTFQKAGYQEQAARLPRNNGFDGVWFKDDADGNLADIIISESKFSSTGAASLTKTKTMGQQLSSEWIDGNISKMRLSADAEVRRTARMLERNRDLIRTKAAVIDPSGIQRFNQINLPE